MNFLLGILMTRSSGELNYRDTKSDCRMWLAMKALEGTNPPPQTLQYLLLFNSSRLPFAPPPPSPIRFTAVFIFIVCWFLQYLFEASKVGDGSTEEGQSAMKWLKGLNKNESLMTKGWRDGSSCSASPLVWTTQVWVSMKFLC